MKYVLILSILFASVGFAKTSLKITGEMDYQFHAGKVPPPVVGLGLYQTLAKKLAYNTWTGLGHQARLNDPTVQWLATRHELIYYMGSMTEVSLNYSYKKANQPADTKENVLEDEHLVGVKVALKIL